mmetsp:Transcript_14745/g.34525  ORF Transcript_14745/g.34525 Transcript_14745/m.34525 type:complete len:407 (-) Transcript_14745:2828-4048(-)
MDLRTLLAERRVDLRVRRARRRSLADMLSQRLALRALAWARVKTLRMPLNALRPARRAAEKRRPSPRRRRESMLGFFVARRSCLRRLRNLRRSARRARTRRLRFFIERLRRCAALRAPRPSLPRRAPMRAKPLRKRPLKPTAFLVARSARLRARRSRDMRERRLMSRSMRRALRRSVRAVLVSRRTVRRSLEYLPRRVMRLKPRSAIFCTPLRPRRRMFFMRWRRMVVLTLWRSWRSRLRRLRNCLRWASRSSLALRRLSARVSSRVSPSICLSRSSRFISCSSRRISACVFSKSWRISLRVLRSCSLARSDVRRIKFASLWAKASSAFSTRWEAARALSRSRVPAFCATPMVLAPVAVAVFAAADFISSSDSSASERSSWRLLVAEDTTCDTVAGMRRCLGVGGW